MSDPTVLSPEAGEVLRQYEEAKRARDPGADRVRRTYAVVLAEQLLAENAQTAEDAAMPPPEFFEAMAKHCRCCPVCGTVPCDGCCAGGVCDGFPCRCQADDEQGDPDECEHDRLPGDCSWCDPEHL